ncbi:MAG TPA: hypothetical protein VN665_01355 [Candidatus Paceibacterota bacterium]|nr:hypothetical protein [Candidatus Paceibacterota bacterium]
MNTQLQDICVSQGLPIYRSTEGEGAIEVIATGDYPMTSHWFRIVERKNDQVGVLLEFPSCERAEIESVERFCELVSEVVFGSIARLYFDTAAKHFFLGGLTGKETLASHLTSLAYSCDVAIPLCATVGRQGWWNEETINLALVDPKDLHSA